MANGTRKRFPSGLWKATALVSSLAVTTTMTYSTVAANTRLPIPENIRQQAVNYKSASESTGGTKDSKRSNMTAKNPRPNIVYIVLDDMGFSDLGAYGSEIKTPNIDQLAAMGLRYTNFNVTPLCSPTRASLLTGRNHHSVGMGSVANFDLGPDNPNTRGRITPAAATVAEILKDQGYSTLGSGKWHLAPTNQITPAGPFDNWPLGKGFERFYGFLEGETDQYHPQLIYDNHVIDPPKKPGYHLSEDLVDQAKQFVTDVTSVYPEKPFFLYLTFGATHSPHQVPEKYIDMYKGVYDKGWDKIHQERFERQKKMGIIPANTKLVPRDPGVKPWDSLSKEEKLLFARFQETYAGFLTHTDEQIGRMVDFLKSIGELENTMIVLISDNGATADGGPVGVDSFVRKLTGNMPKLTDLEPRINEIGGPDFQALYPMGWARVSNTPFPFYKWSTYGGGTRTPLIISWPAGIRDKGTIRSQYVHVIDITPTVLDVLDIKAPETYRGAPQMPMHGLSIADTFDNANAPAKRKTQYFRMFDSRAIYHEGWKAVSNHISGQPYVQDKWALYKVDEDFSETRNFADQYPEKLQEMQNLWWAEAGKYGALPLKERSMKELVGYIAPESAAARNTFKYLPGMGHLGSPSSAPQIGNRSYTITVPVNRPDKSNEGVLVSQGDSLSGYTFFIKNNHLVYEYNYFGTLYRVESKVDVPTGSSTISFEYKKTSPTSGTGILYVNNKKVGEGLLSKTLPGFVSFEGLDVGRDSLSPVSKSYRDKGEFSFTGQIESVTFDLH